MAHLLDRAGIEARIMMYGFELRTDEEDVWLETVGDERANELLAERRYEARQRWRKKPTSGDIS